MKTLVSSISVASLSDRSISCRPIVDHSRLDTRVFSPPRDRDRPSSISHAAYVQQQSISAGRTLLNLRPSDGFEFVAANQFCSNGHRTGFRYDRTCVRPIFDSIGAFQRLIVPLRTGNSVILSFVPGNGISSTMSKITRSSSKIFDYQN
jgi:hypothetical protein